LIFPLFKRVAIPSVAFALIPKERYCIVSGPFLFLSLIIDFNSVLSSEVFTVAKIELLLCPLLLNIISSPSTVFKIFCE